MTEKANDVTIDKYDKKVYYKKMDMIDTGANKVELTIAMLEELFKGRDLDGHAGYLLPNGEKLSAHELRLLFADYTT